MRNLILSVLTFISVSTFADSICEILLTPTAYLKTESGQIFPNNENVAVFDKQTVLVFDVSPELLAKGFVKKLVKRDGLPWFSEFAPVGDALQGDSRAPFIILGRELAAVLGYFMPDDKTILIPSVERINQGIALINSYLPADQKIPYTFYEQIEGQSIQYLEGLAELRIGLSSKDKRWTAHDNAFHALEVMAPIHYVHRIQISVRDGVLPYLKYVQSEVPERAMELRLKFERFYDTDMAAGILLLGNARLARWQYRMREPELREFRLIAGSLLLKDLLRDVSENLELNGASSFFVNENRTTLRAADNRMRQTGPVARNFIELIKDYMERRRILREAARKVIKAAKDTSFGPVQETPASVLAEPES